MTRVKFFEVVGITFAGLFMITLFVMCIFQAYQLTHTMQVILMTTFFCSIIGMFICFGISMKDNN